MSRSCSRGSQQGDLVAVAAGTLGLTAQGRLDGELQMTVAGIEKVIPALGIEKMLDEGVPQATLDRVAPGVKTQDLNNLFGALDRAIPGLGKAVKQNANVGVAAGINALGKEAVLEGRKARAFPLRFVDGAVFLGPLKVGADPAAVLARVIASGAKQPIVPHYEEMDCFVACAPLRKRSAFIAGNDVGGASCDRQPDGQITWAI